MSIGTMESVARGRDTVCPKGYPVSVSELKSVRPPTTDDLYRAEVFLTRLVRKPVVEGLGNIPSSGRVIVVANHTSIFNQAMFAAALPRPIYGYAKKELFIPTPGSDEYDFARRYGRYAMTRIGGIPSATGRAYARHTLNEAGKILEAGGIFGLFAEGKINKILGEFHGGAAWLSFEYDAIVVPANIQERPDGSTLIRFGPPLHPKDFAPVRKRGKRNTKSTANLHWNRKGYREDYTEAMHEAVAALAY